MSDTQRPKSAGDKLAADEINRDLPVTMTGGETIDTSSNPIAVYLKAADGKIYKTDADAGDEQTYGFVGFLVEDTSNGNDAIVQTHGVVSGFSGLTAGSIYFLSDTAGAISTSPGTREKQVGIAISSTELLIKEATHPEYMGSANGSASITAPAMARMAVCIIQADDNAAPDHIEKRQVTIFKFGKTSETVQVGKLHNDDNVTITASWSLNTITISTNQHDPLGTCYFFR